MAALDVISAATKQIPAFCWLMACVCLAVYTGTMCYVMVRASTVNVEINGMTVELTRAATQQDSAAEQMDRAARTIADLRLELAALTAKAVEPRLSFFSAKPAVPVVAPKAEIAEEELKAKATELRESSQQTQQRIQQYPQQQQQQGR